MGLIVPSKLHRVKIFESTEWLSPADGGFERSEESDPILEVQINDWVMETQALVINVGPVSIVRAVENPEDTDNSLTMVTRTIALTYAPAVEQGEQVDDAENVQSLAGEADAAGAGAGPRGSDGGFSGEPGGRLRLPDLPEESVPGRAGDADRPG
jgi:hypothetical protein